MPLKSNKLKTKTWEKNTFYSWIIYFCVKLLGLGQPADNTMQYLEKVAIQIAKDIAAGKITVDRSKKSVIEKVTETAMQWDWVKNIIFNKAKEQVMKASRGLYPAPLKVCLY